MFLSLLRWHRIYNLEQTESKKNTERPELNFPNENADLYNMHWTKQWSMQIMHKL